MPTCAQVTTWKTSHIHEDCRSPHMVMSLTEDQKQSHVSACCLLFTLPLTQLNSLPCFHPCPAEVADAFIDCCFGVVDCCFGVVFYTTVYFSIRLGWLPINLVAIYQGFLTCTTHCYTHYLCNGPNPFFLFHLVFSYRQIYGQGGLAISRFSQN